jgi:diaminopimelate decarboxylase
MNEILNKSDININVIEKVVQKLKKNEFKHKELCAYIYDLNSLQNHVSSICDLLPSNCEMFYATKANSENKILNILNKCCNGFEVASIGELHKIYNQYPNTKIIFGGPGKTDEELLTCLKYKVEFIHVESMNELVRLRSICEEQNQQVDILLRVNLQLENLYSTKLMMGGKPSPFGMDEYMLHDSLCFLSNQKYINLKGLHFHLASFQVDEDAHLELVKKYINFLHKINYEYHLTLEHINFGGGIGVNYQDKKHCFKWKYFLDNLSTLLSQQDNSNLKTRFECGRSLSVYCGYYVAEVIDIKKSYNKTYVIVRGGTNHFRTPYAQSHSHPFEIAHISDWSKKYPRINIESTRAHIVGQLCTPKDMLAFDEYIDYLSTGDIIIFSHAGAYAWNISHHDFLCHPHPEKYFIG